ncbi:hypothetical protein BLOT_011911 [Blomia tropicalis]|nr:hypothetical protein BLOT_011911 [Blomia tropicalis]
MTNIPINILLLRRNVFENQTMFEKSLAWMSCAVCHKPSKFIPILQPMLKDPRKWLWYKIKYEDLYMRLVDDGPKIGIAIGPVQTVTYRSSLEALYLYVGYILMAFSQMITENIEQLNTNQIYGDYNNIIKLC